MVITFKESANIEIISEDDEVYKKITEIEESIEKLSIRENNNNNGNIINIRQIIWLNFSGKSEVYSQKVQKFSEEAKKESIYCDNKIILFTSSSQIISFFKYLFAIKPKMQFKNLEDKFAIVIENEIKSNPKILESLELQQIYLLFDWMNFASCKIPVIIYSDSFKFEESLRMNLINLFTNISFIDSKYELDNFLKINKQEISPRFNNINYSSKKRKSQIDFYNNNINSVERKLNDKKSNLNIFFKNKNKEKQRKKNIDKEKEKEKDMILIEKFNKEKTYNSSDSQTEINLINN
jgi:hypothetical protein